MTGALFSEPMGLSGRSNASVSRTTLRLERVEPLEENV